jgi:uncharacterized membrane protein YhaH (DUF805 family)
MTLEESIRTCFNKYADFNGRATRSEYWWFMLFLFLVSAGLNMVNRAGVVAGLFSLATLIPSFAAGARRLHDTNRSGWWQLLFLVPIIGWILLLVWEVQASDTGSNRFDSAQ